MSFDRCSGERAAAIVTADARMLVTDGKRFAIDGERLLRVPAVATDGAIFLGRIDGTPLFVVSSGATAASAVEGR